jgi:integrase
VSVALAEHLRRYGTAEVVLPWREPGGDAVSGDLLFTNRDRGPLTRAYFTHNAWKPALAAAGVERTRETGMHALRHHYASVLLDGGVSIRAVSEYLGHHDPGFTLRTYAHLMPESEDRARDAIDAAHGAPAEPVRNAEDAEG